MDGDAHVFSLSVKDASTPEATLRVMGDHMELTIGAATTAYKIDSNGTITMNGASMPADSTKMVSMEFVKISQALMGVRVDGMYGAETQKRQNEFNAALTNLNTLSEASLLGIEEQLHKVTDSIQNLSMGTMISTNTTFDLFTTGLNGATQLTTASELAADQSFTVVPRTDTAITEYISKGNALGAEILLQAYCDKVNSLTENGTHVVGELTLSRINPDNILQGFKIDVEPLVEIAPATDLTVNNVADAIRSSLTEVITDATSDTTLRTAIWQRIIADPASNIWTQILSVLPPAPVDLTPDTHAELRTALTAAQVTSDTVILPTDLATINNNAKTIAQLLVPKYKAELEAEHAAKLSTLQTYLNNGTNSGAVTLGYDGSLVIDNTKTGGKDQTPRLSGDWTFENGTISITEAGTDGKEVQIKLKKNGDISSIKNATKWGEGQTADGIYTCKVFDHVGKEAFKTALIQKTTDTSGASTYFLIAAKNPKNIYLERSIPLTLAEDGQFRLTQSSA